MTNRILAASLALALASLPLRPAAAQASASHQVRACQQSVGNAALEVGGLAQVGGVLHLRLAGEPLRPFVLLLDSEADGHTLAGVQLCVGPDPIVLADGFQNPFFVLPPSGVFQMDLPIPDDAALAGQTFHLQGAIADAASPNGLLAVSNLASFQVAAPGPVETVFFEDFEAGWGSWWVTNGTWEIGAPSSGPGAAWSGLQCAATSLAGNYPNTTTRLVSPAMHLPPLGPGQELRLDYRVWFSLSDYDSTTVQVSTDGGQTWATPACTTSLTGTGSGVWSQASADLSDYADQTLVLGFRLSSAGNYSSSGAYLDDLRVVRGTPFFASPQDWEDGLGPWWTVSNGTWEVGAPTYGPSSARSGNQCAGTNLDGTYTNNTSRLISPPLELPVGSPQLWFWHWFSLSDYDYGYVDVSIDDGCTWINLSGYSGTSNGSWTPTMVPLAAYAGQTVRLALRMQTGGNYTSSGWYVDDLEIK